MASAGLASAPSDPPSAENALSARRLHLATIALLFFASGLSGLVYQELWLRLLGLVFGVTVYAASAVLAGFMGGLALGSAFGGRWADRTRRPLLLYGVAEVLVGLSALATPLLLDGVARAYVAVHPLLPPGTLTAARFVLSITVLLAPTMLMGATFPLVVRASLRGARPLGEDASVLYAANTAGGIAGTLLAGFWMIGGIGIGASFRVAAAINVAVGLIAIALSMTREQGAVPTGRPSKTWRTSRRLRSAAACWRSSRCPASPRSRWRWCGSGCWCSSCRSRRTRSR